MINLDHLDAGFREPWDPPPGTMAFRPSVLWHGSNFLLLHDYEEPRIFAQIAPSWLGGVLTGLCALGPRRFGILSEDDIARVIRPEWRVEPQIQLNYYQRTNFVISPEERYRLENPPPRRKLDAASLLSELGL